jgi:hypothetical protein
MYITTFDRLFDSVWNDPFISEAVTKQRKTYGNFDVEVLENGKQKLQLTLLDITQRILQ